MDVCTGEFKDLASCFLLNVNRTGHLAILAGHKVYGLVKLDQNLSLLQTTKRLWQNSNCPNSQIQDVKFSKGPRDNFIAEATTNKIILYDYTTDLNIDRSTEFRSHTRDITCIDWNEQTDLLGKYGSIYYAMNYRSRDVIFTWAEMKSLLFIKVKYS